MESELELMAYAPMERETTTTKIKKSFIQILRDLHIVEKLDITAEDAHAAWVTAQKIERRQKRRDEADVRALSAHMNTLKANTKDED